jgi:hypothetical protein
VIRIVGNSTGSAPSVRSRSVSSDACSRARVTRILRPNSGPTSNQRRRSRQFTTSPMIVTAGAVIFASRMISTIVASVPTTTRCRVQVPHCTSATGVSEARPFSISRVVISPSASTPIRKTSVSAAQAIRSQRRRCSAAPPSRVPDSLLSSRSCPVIRLAKRKQNGGRCGGGAGGLGEGAGVPSVGSRSSSKPNTGHRPVPARANRPTVNAYALAKNNRSIRRMGRQENQKLTQTQQNSKPTGPKKAKPPRPLAQDFSNSCSLTNSPPLFVCRAPPPLTNERVTPAFPSTRFISTAGRRDSLFSPAFSLFLHIFHSSSTFQSLSCSFFLPFSDNIRSFRIQIPFQSPPRTFPPFPAKRARAPRRSGR